METLEMPPPTNHLLMIIGTGASWVAIFQHGGILVSEHPG